MEEGRNKSWRREGRRVEGVEEEGLEEGGKKGGEREARRVCVGKKDEERGKVDGGMKVRKIERREVRKMRREARRRMGG